MPFAAEYCFLSEWFLDPAERVAHK